MQQMKIYSNILDPLQVPSLFPIHTDSVQLSCKAITHNCAAVTHSMARRMT